MPDNAENLLDRPEYWIIYKNFYNEKNKQLCIADELCFKLNELNGNLSFSINGILINECLFSVDLTQRLWFFVDLCGKTNAVRIIQTCNSNVLDNENNQIILNSSTDYSEQTLVERNVAHENSNATQICTKKRSRPNSALVEFYKSQLSSNEMQFDKNKSNNINNNSQIKRKDSAKSVNSSTSSSKEECRICWDAPIECVFYSCGHMCLCWKW